MDFSFTKEQNAIRDAARSFAQKELLPTYTKWDVEENFPLHLWKKMGELGFIGTNVSPENGGQGLGYTAVGIISEELARGDSNLSEAATVVGELTGLLLENASEKMKKKYLHPMLEGDVVMGFALTEPHCGTDASAMQSTAIKKGDKYILNGEKSGTTLLKAADAILVFAKTDPAAGAKGVSLLVVPTDSPGITRQYYEDMGARSLVRGSFFMDNVEIPTDNILGKEGEGFRLGMKGFDVSRVLLALICLGAAQVTLEETIGYVKERHAFNRPIVKFEGVSFPLVEHLSILESVRLLCYKALWLRDQGLPHTKEAAMVKWMAPRFSGNAIRDCLLMHGHYGYTKDYPIEQRLRDVLGIEIADGTSQVSKIVAGREIFGREFLPY